jgi:cell division protein FtsA
MRENDSPLLILSVGTSGVAALKASPKADGAFQIDAWKKKAPAGFDQGLVRDAEVATETVESLLSEVAGRDGMYEFPLYLTIQNSGLKSYRVNSSVYFPETKVIDEADVRKVVSQTKAVATIPLDDVILCDVPEEFLVNDLAEIKNPLGLEGRRLAVTQHIFTLPNTAYRGFTLLLDRLELEAEMFIPQGVAAACLVLREDEKREGVLLWEIGGQVSQLFYYYQGALRAVRTIPWGGEIITERIGRRWDIPARESRRMKEESANLSVPAAGGEYLLSLDPAGKVRARVETAAFQEEIRKAAEEGLAACAEGIREIKAVYPEITQVVASGGMAAMEGFLELAQAKLEWPARLGFAAGIHGPQELISHPASNGILGALKYVSAGSADDRAVASRPGLMERTVRGVRGWIQDYF